MAIDWDKVEEDNKPNYKPYAEEGTYKTKVSEVNLKEASTGRKGIEFKLADNDEYAFPKYGAVAWLFDKDSFRQHHMKELFVALGFTEDQARKAVEQCEGTKDMAKAYLAMFEQALPKAKEVEVAVYRVHEDDQYCTWDFASEKVRMGRPEKDKKSSKKEEDILEGATEVKDEIDLSDVPF
jgi:hypothetical protein